MTGVADISCRIIYETFYFLQSVIESVGVDIELFSGLMAVAIAVQIGVKGIEIPGIIHTVVFEQGAYVLKTVLLYHRPVGRHKGDAEAQLGVSL